MTHSIEQVKRNAKRIKKEQQITHHEALELAAVNAGASSWKHFLELHNKQFNNGRGSFDNGLTEVKRVEYIGKINTTAKGI